MYKKFKSDPNYLTKYHLYSCFLIGIGLILMALIAPPKIETLLVFLPAILLASSPDIRWVFAALVYSLLAAWTSESFSALNLIWIPLGLLSVFPLTMLIHNPSHDSLKPKWLNRLAGEFTGLFHMIGFPDWKIIHIFHHQYSDDPKLDPHPPGNLSYLKFALSMRRLAAAAFVNHYLRIHGNSAQNLVRLKWFSRASRIDMSFRSLLWFCILGPQIFSHFFLVSLMAKMFHYAWFNHSTHRPSANGVELRNLNGGFYTLVNWLALGLYFHENHHKQPFLANPSRLKSETSEAFSEAS